MLFKPKSQPNTFSKPTRAFGNPVSPIKPDPHFNAIPDGHVQPADLSYDIAKLVPPDKLASITAAEKLVFHCLGDSGGIDGTDIQEAISKQMEEQITASAEPDQPAFLYHLGDVVYFNGLLNDYPEQFYEPYKSYPAPIYAIPGNHDGQTKINKGDQPDSEPSLTGFFENFCTTDPRTFAEGASYRYVLDQPWPYWTLESPLVTIIGLYSNVDGSLDDRTSSEAGQLQYNWFVDQLGAADPEKCLILAVHHPPFSLDTAHGGYQDMLDAIDQASAKAGRTPDAIFSGHVHCYQRFTRTSADGRKYPYLIAGAGGYARTYKSMHKLQKDPNTVDGSIPKGFQTTLPDVTLENYNTEVPGFLRITVDVNTLKGEYFVNTFEPAGIVPADAFDAFTLNWKTHQYV